MVPQDPQGPNRRRAPRFTATLPAVARLEGRDCPCAADNLSRSGVLLLGKLPEPHEPDLAITITTPAGDRSLSVSGRVVHVRTDAETGDRSIGLHFERLDAEQEQVLEALVSRVIEGMAPAALAELDPKAPITELRAALSKIPPAHRIMLASRAAPRERALLRVDPHPEVLEALARNPNIVLPEIRALLRRPDLQPSTLEVVASDQRWFHDEEVKLMVATHPRVTFETANRVVSKLNDLQIQRLLRRPGLQQGVRQKLMTKLSGKYRNL